MPKALILIIAGNHDSGERLEFARELLEKEGVFIAGLPPREADEKIRKVTMTDPAGEVCFLSAAIYQTVASAEKIRRRKIDSYEEAVKKIIRRGRNRYNKNETFYCHISSIYPVAASRSPVIQRSAWRAGLMRSIRDC